MFFVNKEYASANIIFSYKGNSSEMKCTKDKGLFYKKFDNGTEVQLKNDKKYVINADTNTLVVVDMSKLKLKITPC
jgi:hypothetical protein